MSKNLRVVGAATATLVIISLIFASPLGVSAQSHVVRYKNCKRFQEAYRETLFAKDDRSRTKYIRYQIDNFYEPEKTVVDRKFYARNRHLDRDRDGVICEDYVNEDYEWAKRFGKFACLIVGDC
jgi:hypothetical protein